MAKLVSGPVGNAQARAASAAAVGEGNGVALPGPMSGGFEEGFDAVGSNMDGIDASPVPTMQGPSMPGWPPHEIGWVYGQDMRGMEDMDPIPEGMNMGTTSNGSDIFGEAISHGNSPEASMAGGGMDSMQGLHGGSVPFTFDANTGHITNAVASGHTPELPSYSFEDGIVHVAPSGM